MHPTEATPEAGMGRTKRQVVKPRIYADYRDEFETLKAGYDWIGRRGTAWMNDDSTQQQLDKVLRDVGFTCRGLETVSAGTTCTT